MLQKILSPESCAKCRYCCVFNDTELWLLPIKEGTTTQDGLTHCPALRENGCSLEEEDKPMECRIWPFQIMRIENRIAITITPTCETIFSVPLKEIYEFVNDELEEKVRVFIDENPDIIIEYMDENMILKFLN